ncbi:NAD(P)-binding domain-containing protein [Conexibacter stalactiti]|uniref:NAD(P)-binding domain-containing protein n=1 Tax=Conexibacter stalactiti TaxID=1940611 RepID=A0ABU4HKP1_9ACTN|nr:NAD(P)-binding domain-containing protein [Conexibacter stalactiti]MDW5593875.1 NAD(P)-binding domain-containing protein [Conexibacter stalactiti]MEC5034517.1 NAD(P)-binding domain-containing protein [Conexibacter stalactiti]
MRIGTIGSGTMAAALGSGWARAGHELLIGGRSPERSAALAARLGASATAVTPRAAAEQADALLLAVLWEGVEEALTAAGGADGALAGKLLIDCSNAVEHGIGTLLTPPGEAAAQRVAALAPGAHVVKAFHLFPAAQWEGGPASAAPGDATPAPGPVVPICGDDPAALETAFQLVRDVGGRPFTLGPLARARQLEEVAGFVIGLAFGGADPAAAIPAVPAAA